MSNGNWIDVAGHRPGVLGTVGLGLLLGAFFAFCTWCMGGMLVPAGAQPGQGPWAYLVTVMLGVLLLFAARWWMSRPKLSAADARMVEAYPWNAAGKAVLAANGSGQALTYGDVRRAARAHFAQSRQAEAESNRREAHLAMDSMMTRYNGEG